MFALLGETVSRVMIRGRAPAAIRLDDLARPLLLDASSRSRGGAGDAGSAASFGGG